MKKSILVMYNMVPYYISEDDYNKLNNSKLFAYEDIKLTKLAKHNGKQLMFRRSDVDDILKENKTIKMKDLLIESLVVIK